MGKVGMYKRIRKKGQLKSKQVYSSRMDLKKHIHFMRISEIK